MCHVSPYEKSSFQHNWRHCATAIIGNWSFHSLATTNKFVFRIEIKTRGHHTHSTAKNANAACFSIWFLHWKIISDQSSHVGRTHSIQISNRVPYFGVIYVCAYTTQHNNNNTFFNLNKLILIVVRKLGRWMLSDKLTVNWVWYYSMFMRTLNFHHFCTE